MIYKDKVNHFEDDNGYDLFVPFKESLSTFPIAMLFESNSSSGSFTIDADQNSFDSKIDIF